MQKCKWGLLLHVNPHSAPASFLQSRWRSLKSSSSILLCCNRDVVTPVSIFFIEILVLVTPIWLPVYVRVCVCVCTHVGLYVFKWHFAAWWHVELIRTPPRTLSVYTLTDTHSSHTKYTNLTTLDAGQYVCVRVFSCACYTDPCVSDFMLILQSHDCGF